MFGLIDRVVALILHINASSKVLTLHSLQRMNQIQLPTNIQAIRLETKPINTMSHHFQMLVNSNKEVINRMCCAIAHQPDKCTI